MSQLNNPPSLQNAIIQWLSISVGFAIISGIVMAGVDGGGESWQLLNILFLSVLFLVYSSRFIYLHAKAYGRNAVAWATAFVFFSPLWAGIAYLLTWPKDANEMRQRQVEKEEVVERHCPKCGSKVKRKAKFCAECGENLIEYEATDWQCEECGGEIGKDDKFCITCGVEFARDREETGAQDSK